jgi:hypothetical protein
MSTKAAEHTNPQDEADDRSVNVYRLDTPGFWKLVRRYATAREGKARSIAVSAVLSHVGIFMGELLGLSRRQDARQAFEQYMSDRGEAVGYEGDGLYRYRSVNDQSDAFRAGADWRDRANFSGTPRTPIDGLADEDLWLIAGVAACLARGNLSDVNQRECVTAIRAAFADPDSARSFIASQRMAQEDEPLAYAAPVRQAFRAAAENLGIIPLTSCRASRDGECGHAQCPQLRDNEPATSGRHCPLATDSDANDGD